MPHRIVMVATSYPRFPGDAVGTFMEPIAQGVASRGHDVHLVAPWHPRITRRPQEGGVTFHYFRYAPLESLNVFGYAASLRADVEVRWAAYAMAPAAICAGWLATRRVARRIDATLVHGHWVVPGGFMARAAAGKRPLVVSLHGSDVYLAERSVAARLAARAVFRHAAWVTACSDDLGRRAQALGAQSDRLDVIPYGVDANRFSPDPASRARGRARLGLNDRAPIVFAAGRLVRKKGFEYLIDAAAALVRDWPDLTVVIGGEGDLDAELRTRAVERGLGDRIRFAGVLAHGDVADCLAAADVAVVPSVRDDSGNVDGLPNAAMEALASATPLVATNAGGIGNVATDRETALLVPERDVPKLAKAIDRLLRDPDERARLGTNARALVVRRYGWTNVIDRFEAIYDRVAKT